jgi:hypothetical protein
MVNFKNDQFAAMVQDESGGRTKPHRHDSSSSTESSDEAAPPRRARRSSVCGSAGVSRSKSNSEGRPNHRSGGTSTRSLDGVDAAQAPVRRSGGRRATISAGGLPRNSRNVSSRSSDLDYGYSDQNESLNDTATATTTATNIGNAVMGYGDAAPDSAAEAPVRRRRERRCSIAEVTSSSSTKPAPVDSYGYGDVSSSAITANPSTVTNIAIPMAENTHDKPRQRRASLLGNITRSSKDKQPGAAEPAQEKKGADRDRRRQGTLMDRVGAAPSSSSRSTAGRSYSDRIMSK